MVFPSFRVVRPRPIGLLLLSVVLLLLGSCGGGGSAPNTLAEPDADPTPTPRSQRTPTPVASPALTPPLDGVEILLREGDALPGGGQVASFDEAKIGSQGSVAFVASDAVPGRPRVVGHLSPQGVWKRIFDIRSVDDEEPWRPVSALERYGDEGFIFLAGEDLDDRALFAWNGVDLETIADVLSEEGIERIGDVAAGQATELGFIVGFTGCFQTEEGSDRCELGLVRKEGTSTLENIRVPETLLLEVNPKSPRTRFATPGSLYFSLPGRASEPVLIRLEGDEVEVLLRADGELSNLGRLLRPELVQLNPSGTMVLRATLADDERPRPGVLVRFDGVDGDLITSVESGGEEGDEPGTISAIGSIGIDDSSAVLFQVLLRPEDSEDDPRRSLRRWSEGVTTEIATEREIFEGDDLYILKIEDPFQNRHGDVAFVGTFGTIEEGPSGLTTTWILESRIVLLPVDGVPESVITSSGNVALGQLRELAIYDFTDDREFLVGAEREGSGAELLLRIVP